MADTQTAARKGKPVTTKAAPKGKAEVAATVGQGSIQIKRAACSLDLGPSIIAAWAGDEARKAEITNELSILTTTRRWDLIAQLTAGIVKAARNDESIDLSLAFTGDTKKQTQLNNLIGIALGFRTVVTSAPDKNGISYDTVVNHPAVKDFFTMPGETEQNTPNFVQKKNFGKNFASALKKCAGSAQAIIDRKIEAEYDKKLGTLVISGPEVKKRFGQETVVLNGSKTVGEGATKVELNEKPSFQALSVWGGETVGAAAVPSAPGTAGSRGTKPGTIGGGAAAAADKATKTLKPDAAMIYLCDTLVKAIEKYEGEITAEVMTAFDSVTNAIDVKLDAGNE